MRDIEGVRQARKMPWLRCGMAVEVNGKRGVITGAGTGCNIFVRFHGERRSHNCHPQWMTTYYEKDGSIIATYQ